MSELPAKESDLAGMKHLVVGTPEQRPEFRLYQGMGCQNCLVELGLVKSS
jgi:hypothetical protein